MTLKTTVVLTLFMSLAWLVGCTDVPSTGPTPPTFFSQYRFVNGSADLSSISMSMDLGPAVSVNFGSSTSYQEYPSGSREGAISGGTDTLRIAATVEQRGTILILGMQLGTREFRKMIERRVFDAVAVDTASITLPINDATGAHVSDSTFAGATNGQWRFVLGIRDTTVDISIKGADVTLPDGNTMVNEGTWAGEVFAPGILQGYNTNLLPGDYTVTVTESASGSVLVTTSISIGNRRHTSAIISDGATVSIVNLED